MKTFRPGGLELTRRAAEAIGLCGGQTVLDVGCGTGATLRYLTDRFGVQGHGVDISAEAVRRSGSVVPEAVLRTADGCALPYPEGTFDAVFMECTLTLMSDPAAALREAMRVLKGDGSLVVSGLSVKNSDEEGLCDRGRIVEPRFTAALEDAGLRPLLFEDRSDELVQFCADAIFWYGSLETYVAAARETLCGCVLDCRVPVKGTGYLLAAAKKSL